MKTLIFLLVLMVVGTSHAQEVTELKEAKVGFAPLSADVEADGNSFSFTVKESFHREFERNPIAFMETYFNIDNFIEEVKHKEFDGYEVSFSSSKGILEVSFDRDGDLVRSNSKFKNIILPESLRDQLYRDHKGWAMTKNAHVTHGRNGVIKKNFYKIKLDNGKDRKKVVLQAPYEGTEIVSN